MPTDQLQPTIVNQPFGFRPPAGIRETPSRPAPRGRRPLRPRGTPAADRRPAASGLRHAGARRRDPSDRAVGFSLSKLTPTTILVVGALVAGAWFMTTRPTTRPPTRFPAVPVTQPVSQPSGQSGGQPSGQSGQSGGQPSGQSGQSGGQPSGQSGQSGGQPSGQSGQSDSRPAKPRPLRHRLDVPGDPGQDGAPAVQCSAPNGITVEYAAYASGDTADGALSSLTGGLQTVSANGCSSGSCTYQSNNADQGRDVWFTATVNNAQAVGVAWSSERTGIVGLAIEQGNNNSALVNWWNQDSGPN